MDYEYNPLTTGQIIAIVTCSLILAIFQIAAMWKVFTKARQPGWAAIIPIYNMYVMTKIGGKPGGKEDHSASRRPDPARSSSRSFPCWIRAAPFSGWASTSWTFPASASCRRRSSAPARSSRRPTRSCSRPTRSWRPPTRSSSPRSRSWRPPTRSSSPPTRSWRR